MKRVQRDRSLMREQRRLDRKKQAVVLKYLSKQASVSDMV